MRDTNISESSLDSELNCDRKETSDDGEHDDFCEEAHEIQLCSNAEDEQKDETNVSFEIPKNKSPNKSLDNEVSEKGDCADSCSANTPIKVNLEEIKQHSTHTAELLKEEDSKLSSDLNIKGSSEQLVIQSNNGESFSTTVNLTGAEDLDKALATGEPITFIVVESSGGNETFMSTANENISDKIIQSNIGKTSDASFHLVPAQQCSSTDLPGNKNLKYKCDICQKSFGKCSYLYRHLRKHTGEFTCVTCLAVFARKENLKSHSCSQPKEWFPCPTCGKKFSAKKYLQRHAPMHSGEFSCQECKRNFASRLSLKCHRCSGKMDPEKTMISCFMCERSFDSELKLQSHLKVHSDVNLDKSSPSQTTISKPHISQKHVKRKDDITPEQSQTESADKKVFICEVCGAIFKSSSSMKTHRFLHEERKFECDVCKKRFHRKDVLQEHLRVHQDANFPCSICGKKYKTKKSLYVHSLIHKGSKRFACGECGKEFFQKGNLFKHVQTHTSERMYVCEYCEKSFSSKEYFNIHVLTHTQGKIFQCDACKRSFVKVCKTYTMTMCYVYFHLKITYIDLIFFFF